MNQQLGRQTFRLGRPPAALSWASIGGKQEAEGPLGGFFDQLCSDSTGAIRSSRKYSTLSGKVVVAGSVTMGTTSVPMRTPCKVLAMRISCLSVGCASPCATAGNSANNGSPANNMNFLYITNCNKMK